MASPSTGETASIAGPILGFLGALIWPLFLWFFTRRPDVRRCIGVLLEVLPRLARLKAAGVELEMTPAESVAPVAVKEREEYIELIAPQLPDSERERQLEPVTKRSSPLLP